MSGLEIRWPDAAAERVRVAIGRLEAAGPRLRARPFVERHGSVSRIVGELVATDSPWRRELVESFAATSGFSPQVVREGLDAALLAWDPRHLIASAERELAGLSAEPESRARHTDPIEGGGLTLAPYAWTLVWAGGTIPMPTLLSSLLPLVVGSPVLLRESTKDPITGPLLARLLADCDAELAQAFVPLALDRGDDDALDELLRAPCVVATGSDATMSALANRLRVEQRFVAYGHRVSIAVLGRSLPFDRDAVARALALDVARWDQTGCLSPIAAYLVGFDPSESRAFAASCHSALAELGATHPRGTLAPADGARLAAERASARMRAASGRAEVFEGGDSIVVLESDTEFRDAPLHRFLRIHTLAGSEALDGALTRLGAPLSSVALAGLAADERSRVVSTLTQFGASRLTEPGRLQTPRIDWPRDGMPLFTPLARFVRSE